MNVICIHDEAFEALLSEISDRLLRQYENTAKSKWISDEEAMGLLRIKSKTTLANLRNNGKIRFSQPMKRLILYDTESIEDYLEQNAQDTF
ncbi:MAG: helix-turn-helix domain-containing protein [Gelidibacter sp.]|nr:helix-turn-helix domain-containing protein [Gelidibacter sp.]